MPGQAFISDKSGSGILFEPPFALFPEFTPVPPFSALRSPFSAPPFLRPPPCFPSFPPVPLFPSFPLSLFPSFPSFPLFPSFPFIPRL